MKEKILLLNHYFNSTMKRAVDRMKIQQFLKRNKTAQNLYDKGMGALDLGYNIGMKGLPGMLTGSGLYRPDIRTNDLISSTSMEEVPTFSSSPDRGVLISRREYVSEIYGPPLVGGLPQAFVLQSFQINPGLDKTFPWLSQLACNFDEYTIHQLVFTFKSTTTESGNQTNGQVGTILMATNYNAAAQSFTDKVTMLQYAHAVSDRLTATIQHGVECDPSKLSGSPGEYIRSSPVVSNQDLKTYDHGKFEIAVANCAKDYANVSLGELWVSYTIELRKPRFYASLGFCISKDIFLSNGGESFSDPMGVNSALGILKGQQNNIGCSISLPANNQTRITFPPSFRGNVTVIFVVSPLILAGAISPYTQIMPAGAPTSVTGNVTGISDLYGNNVVAGEVLDTPVGAVYSASFTNGLIMITHLAIDIATNGVENSFTQITALAGTAGAIPNQVYLEITEFNRGFSYKSTATGSSDTPVWLNSAGVVIVP